MIRWLCTGLFFLTAAAWSQPLAFIATTTGGEQPIAGFRYNDADKTVRWSPYGNPNADDVTTPFSELLAIRFSAEPPAAPQPIPFQRIIYPGDWQQPSAFSGSSVGTSSVTAFEVTKIQHNSKETTAVFRAKLFVIADSVWTFTAIAPDRLGLAVDGKTILTHESPQQSASAELEAGVREITVSVPCNKARNYEIRVESPFGKSDLAALLTTGPPSWRVRLRDGSELLGRFGAGKDDGIAFVSPVLGEIPLKWADVTGLAPVDGDWPALARAQGSRQDLLLVSAKERIVELAASVLKIDATHVHVRHDDAERKIALARLLGFTRQAAAPEGGASEVRLVDGSRIRGQIVGISDKLAIMMLAGWDADVPLMIPAGQAENVLLTPPACTFLSDLEPTEIRQRAWFDFPVPYRVDSGFGDATARIADQSFGRALALHAYTRLAFAAPPANTRFLASIGIEQGAPAAASAHVRILHGETIVAEKSALAADDAPWEIDIPLAASAPLILEVDFGADEDIGDRVIFGNPRLLTVDQGASP